jgi:hypothetical protein
MTANDPKRTLRTSAGVIGALAIKLGSSQGNPLNPGVEILYTLVARQTPSVVAVVGKATIYIEKTLIGAVIAWVRTHPA